MKYDSEAIKNSVDILQVIESETGETATKKGSDYKICCPFHSERTPSFNINVNDQFFKCFGCDAGGDVIEFIMKYRNLDFNGACEYMTDNFKANGENVPENKPKKKRKPQPKTIMPIPESAIKNLTSELQSKFYQDNYGAPKRVWAYKNENGETLFFTVRFEKDNKKDVIPVKFTKQGWRTGLPITKNRPLFNLYQLKQNPDLPVLIVEGEKCAKIQVEGYVSVSWSSGTKSLDKTDFTPLQGRNVTIWPDNDKEGIKAAESIYNMLKDKADIKILKAWGNEKQDIADYVGEFNGKPLKPEQYERNPVDYISSAELHEIEKSEHKNEQTDEIQDGYSEMLDRYFKCLGWDDDCHYFLPKGALLPYKIKRGGFTSTKLLELAPLDVWNVLFPPAKSGNYDFNAAVDFVVSESHKKGFYDLDRVRGAGVWLEDGKFIINTGKCLYDSEKKTKLSEHNHPNHNYVMSQADFGQITDSSTIEDGKNLIEVFKSCNFASELDLYTALGWSLLAPFGSALAWRPHTWLSGQSGSGKSWLLENLIEPLCGKFAFSSSTQTTEAGIRRALTQDCRPVIVDEAEGTTEKARLKIQSILELCRNASSNASSDVVMAAPGGGVERFRIRSMFCFASVATSVMNAPLQSRIAMINLRINKANQKFKNIGQVMKLLPDWSAFRSRTFRKLPEILKDSESLNNEIRDVTGNQRRADLYSPIISAVWHVYNDCELDYADPEMSVLINGACEQEKTETDESFVFNELLNHMIRIIGEKELSVSDILYDMSKNTAIDHPYDTMLRNCGIRFVDNFGKEINGKYISKAILMNHNHSYLRAIFKNTAFENYKDVFLRHPACISEKLINYRISKTNASAIVFDWEIIREMYFNED